MEFAEFTKRPAIDGVGVGLRQLSSFIGGRRVVVQIAQQIANGISDLAVTLASGREEGHINFDIAFVWNAKDPPSAHLSADLLQEIFHLNGVADRLGHLLAIFVHDESVSDQRLERRLARGTKSRKKTQLEPTTMLIGTFQVQIRREAQAALAQDCVPA